MSKANIFLLLPETTQTNKTTPWSLTNDEFDNKEKYETFMKNKITEIQTITIENYQGYFDGENFKNFFEGYDMFEDIYPNALKNKFRRKLIFKEAWKNWQEKPQQIKTATYSVFGQKINNHSLAEIAQHKQNRADETFALLNNNALNIQVGEITVHIIENNSTHSIDISNVKDIEEIKEWFAENRLPKRKFHLIPKHGENGRGSWNTSRGNDVSLLMCSKEEAQELLNRAIVYQEEEDEDNILKKLYNYDVTHNMFIKFFNENEPQNQYHGFHLPLDSHEIPNSIKKKLLS